MEEKWADITGYEGLYQVSNWGKVKSISRTIRRSNGRLHTVKEKYLKLFPDNCGYMVAYLNKSGKKHNFRVHRLVAKAFIPNLKNKPQVNHKDGNKTNNNVENLEWCTNGENQIHAFQNGLNHHKSLFGCDNPTSKEIIMCDLNGNEIERFGSITEASRTIGIPDTNIITVAKGTKGHKTAGGYVWKYANE
jgi:hypothetical protein